ncbi:MAG: carbon-nitrogen hydrolase family protein [Dehalococcoidia bacterium]|nr:carbon-nitrogen hydrolase family protein [Dehalococcoidia bacterium]
MKAVVHASLVQFNPRWLDRERNADRMRAFAEDEAREGADLILFPELANIGYIPPRPRASGATAEEVDAAVQYVRAAETIPGPTTLALSDVAARFHTHIVVGIAERHPTIPGTLYNSAALIGPSGIVGVHRKVHLGRDEKQYFYAGNSAQVFDTDIGRLGLLICYDSRFPEIVRAQALKGAEIVCSVWANPRIGNSKGPHRLHMFSYVRALENANFFLSCGRVGEEGGVHFSGHSAAGSPGGELLAASDTEDEEVVRVTLQEKDLLKARTIFPYFRDRRPDVYGILVEPLAPEEPRRAAAEGAVFRPPTRGEGVGPGRPAGHPPAG